MPPEGLRKGARAFSLASMSHRGSECLKRRTGVARRLTWGVGARACRRTRTCTACRSASTGSSRRWRTWCALLLLPLLCAPVMAARRSRAVPAKWSARRRACFSDGCALSQGKTKNEIRDLSSDVDAIGALPTAAPLRCDS